MIPLFESTAATLGMVALAAYLLGSVPFGIVLARLFGLGDLRKIGSGNIGATNVLRTGNKTAAALTLVLDAGKGGIAVLVARALFELAQSAKFGKYFFRGFFADMAGVQNHHIGPFRQICWGISKRC